MKSPSALKALAMTAVGLLATSGAQAATKAKAPVFCDRACLIKLTDQYIAAVVAHDPSKAPLAPDIVFVENIKRIKPGEGLWKTVTAGPTSFKIYIPDEDMQEAAWMGVLQSDGKPVEMALRLKVKNGKIVEAEHLFANAERTIARAADPAFGPRQRSAGGPAPVA